ncbi:MAG: aminodeoxychorismate/anthranilate synthase component II [Epulopiscium sp. Nuni2H_MBin003]|nr:MAG: aminodeoxychorismate/anthranilate synthase component II [Epulopiscium sp. Nuni2H_MBin003]
MILVIDNYDSFTYNLVQIIGEINPNILVKRNDEITVNEVKSLHPTHIILSPGPGKPIDAGICEELILNISDIPILGVCLGHQAICEAFGGTIELAQELMHGKSSLIDIEVNSPLFYGLESKILVSRYHSLIGNNLPDVLDIIGKSANNEVMAVKHKIFNIYGVQFHPESILTKDGKTLMNNFLKL